MEILCRDRLEWRRKSRQYREGGGEKTTQHEQGDLIGRSWDCKEKEYTE